MINNHDMIINNIVLKLSDYIKGDINEIKNIISSELANYTISEIKNELSISHEHNNEYYMNLFLAAKKLEGKSDGTIARYKFVLDKFISSINKSIVKLDTNDIRYFLCIYKRNNSNTTMDGMRRCLSTFFSWLESEDYITKNPVRKLSKIKLDTIKETPYTSAEMEAMMNATDNVRDKTILTMLYSTAVRISELSNIKVTDINFVTKTLHIINGKGGKDRFVPLESKTIYYLEEYFKYREEMNIHNTFLFVSNKGEHNNLKTASIRQMIYKVGEKAKIEHAHPHRFRVTRITDLLRRGMKLEEVQVIAGHEDINTTANYNRCDLSLVDAEFRRVS